MSGIEVVPAWAGLEGSGWCVLCSPLTGRFVFPEAQGPRASGAPPQRFLSGLGAVPKPTVHTDLERCQNHDVHPVCPPLPGCSNLLYDGMHEWTSSKWSHP